MFKVSYRTQILVFFDLVKVYSNIILFLVIRKVFGTAGIREIANKYPIRPPNSSTAHIALLEKDIPVIALCSDDHITVPSCPLHTAAVRSTVALQLLSYHIARLKDCSIDQPRNLAKSVTVEYYAGNAELQLNTHPARNIAKSITAE